MAGLTTENLVVPKTIKLFINGEFPRTESGRSFPCYYKESKKLYANLCLASRKDHRAAVSAAKDAFPAWEARSAYNRSQILYRMAEMAEGKRHEFLEVLQNVIGLSVKDATAMFEKSIDAFIYYAGFCDKYQQIIGAVNPVNGPHHNFTTPEPVGVVGLICEDDSNLAKITSDICSIIATGNTVVVLLPETSSPLLAALAETFATSDLPKGVVNLLSGSTEELYTFFGSHMEIQSLSYQGTDIKKTKEMQILAIENMKRFVPRHKHDLDIENILSFVEYKTVWHPVGC